MPRRFLSLTGFVLAGGASRRMGQDKAHLMLEGETLVARQIRLLRYVCSSVAILGPPASFTELEVPVFGDELGGRGPLGGVYSGLLRTRTEFNLFLGCDLPFMEVGFLRYLCRRALESRAEVVVPESRARQLEPLCGVYRRRALRAVRGSLESGQNKVTGFFSQVRCLVLPWTEIRRARFSPRIFANMNTPEEYEAAKKRLSVVSGLPATHD